MIDFENLRTTVVKGLRRYLGCSVIRSNQSAEAPPYPYASYTVTTLMTQNNGTYGEYADGSARKPVNCIWSITIQSDDNIESVTLANKAREWFDYVGNTYLSDNDVIVQSVGAVTNRDNLLTAEYEYRNGFDVTFWLYDEIEGLDVETIESVTFAEDSNASLESRLDGVESVAYSGNQTQDEEALNELLNNRLDGVE